MRAASEFADNQLTSKLLFLQLLFEFKCDRHAKLAALLSRQSDGQSQDIAANDEQ